MEPGSRKSGIDVIGDVPGGTHFGLFYKTKQDLIDVLVPYFEAGLKNNEFCIWVTAEPLNVEDAKACMAEALPDFDVYMNKGQIEIIPFTEWYKINDVFDPERVLNGWVEKLRNAGEQGFSGLRATGNGSWLEAGDWKDFIEYEQTINDVIGQYDMLAVCSYSLDKCDANDILDVVSTHQFVLIRRNGDWKIIEDQGQKKARKELQESERRFRAIHDQAAMGIAIANRDGLILDCNNAFQAMLGYSIDELRQKHFMDITYLDDIGKNVNLFKQSVAGQIDKYRMEKRYVRKDGSLIWCLLSASVIMDTNGDFKYNLALIDDITERKRAEEKVSHLASFPSLNPNPIVETDLDGNPSYMNPSAITIFQDLNEKRAAHPLLIGLKAVVNELKTSRKKSIIREVAVDGSYFQETIHSVPDKKALRIYVLDITKRKQVEKALNAAKQQADLYVDLMGHDINNIHQAALGYLELARDMPGDARDEYLDKATEALHRSTKLISNVRKLQKFQDNRIQAHDMDVCAVLAGVHKEYAIIPGKTITLNLNGFTHCQVRADDLLHDVFSNLVGNAVKHAGNNAHVSINLDMLLEDGMEYCRVWVDDDGPGISDESKKMLFNRSLKGTPRVKGIGLGLYIVKMLVEYYGGRVWSEDRVWGDHTKGARFVVMLPAIEIK